MEIIKQQGKVVEVIYYPDQGRGFDKLENQIDAARRIVGWFDTHLKHSPAEPTVGR